MSDRDEGQLSFFSSAGAVPRNRRAARDIEVADDAGLDAIDVDVIDVDAIDVDAIDARPPLAVELRRGSTRRRHVEGILRGDTLVVSYPARMSRAEAERVAVELRERMQHRLARERIDLRARTRRLARELDLPMPASVEWSDRQQHRWGSCTPVDRCIRISSRLAAFPTWVLDYVLVHELAHLRHADHGPEFHAIVARYPRAERAVGFLIAQSIYPEKA